MGAARPSVLFRGGRGTKLSTRERRLNRRPRRIESLESRSLLAGDAIISEFMAENEATIRAARPWLVALWKMINEALLKASGRKGAKA